MKKTLLLFVTMFAFTFASFGQTLDADLKAKQAELAAAQSVVDGITAQVASLEDQIEKDAGWITGYTGLLGFDFNKSNGWVASPNPDASSSSLNIGLNGFANIIKENFFWRNKGTLTKSWNDIDLSTADGGTDNDGLFDNGTVDILNINSLAGKPITETFALSGMGELNTSLENFLNPGTMDLGIGGTWTPNIDDLVVVIHPLNYHYAFSGVDAVESAGAIGAKIRADYTHNWGGYALTSTLTTFVPYQSKEPTLFEWTWLNTVSFNIWKGVGVGISAGLRNAEFESTDTQSYYSVGLSYSL